MTDEVETVIADTEIKEQDDFEAEFNKAAQEREDTTTTESAGVEDAATDTTAAKDADANLNTADQDADTSKPDTAKDDVVSDEFEGWTDEQKAKYNDLQASYDDLDHRKKSDDGRVSAFQRQVNDLKREMAQIQQAPGQPSTEDIAAAMGDDESWKAFEEDYPEIAGVMNKRFEAQDNKLETVIAPVIEKANNDAVHDAEVAQQEGYDEVAKVYPKWQDAVKETEFNEWMANQSPGIRALADSDDTRDASLLIGKYDDYRVENGHTTLKSDPGPDNGSSVDEAAEDEVAKRRKQQLEDGVTLPSKSARIDTDAETGSEFENAFNAFAKRKEAANNRA